MNAKADAGVVAQTRRNIADVLCIGCQKGSTSWLHSVLNRHPDVWAFPDSEPVTSTNKEAHFWDWNHKRGVEWYRALMTPPEPHLKTLDFTPEYAFLPDAAIAECKALNPEARIIYILRDPLARAVSALRMHMLWRFGPNHEQPLALDDTLHELIEQARLSRHGDYVGNLAAWRRHYDDILVLNYEAFHADRENSVAQVMAHVGLDPARLTPEARAEMAKVMARKVWESTPFPAERAALVFLHGYTRAMREAVGHELGMRFTEFETLLGG